MNLISVLIGMAITSMLALSTATMAVNSYKAIATQDIRTDINTYIVEIENSGVLPAINIFPYGQARWKVKNAYLDTASGVNYVVFEILSEVSGPKILRRPVVFRLPPLVIEAPVVVEKEDDKRQDDYHWSDDDHEGRHTREKHHGHEHKRTEPCNKH
jgi:hypothetical protein